MTINVNNLTVSQAQYYYLNYNNGNSKGISEAEYQSICTKFSSYISTWESSDENSYTESPEERLDYDSDDAGFISSDGAVTTAATLGAAAAGALSYTGILTKVFGTAKNAEGYALIAAAGYELVTAIILKSVDPNGDAADACETAQDELYTEQANLADNVATLEEMQEEMDELSETAIETNEDGQANIASMEGYYNYYYTKYENGTATSSDIAIMNALASQMKTTQTATNESTTALNGEIVTIGEGFEDISTSIDTTNQFTDYVSDFDSATKNSATTTEIMSYLAVAGCALTAIKCIPHMAKFWEAPLYAAAMAMAGTAGFMYLKIASNNGEYADIASDTIDIRKETQDLSQATTEYQDITTEYWDETVEATSEENLFTLTPTYATGVTSATSSDDSSTDSTEEDSTTTSNTVTTPATDDEDKIIYD